jgi:hypothetical protein
MARHRAQAVRERSNRFVSWGERQLEHRSSSRFGSFLLGCLRRYAESSRNSATALVFNVFLSVVPALLAVYALAGLGRGADSVIAVHLIGHLHLHGSTAVLVSRNFGRRYRNAAAASVIGLLGFLIFGLGIGNLL